MTQPTDAKTREMNGEPKTEEGVTGGIGVTLKKVATVDTVTAVDSQCE